MNRKHLTAACMICFSWPARGHAHGFGERYDLPIPLSYFIAGACASVILTFLLAAWSARSHSTMHSTGTVGTSLTWPMPSTIKTLCRVLGLLALGLSTWAALAGTGDPLMNFAPTWIWIIWWIGLSMGVATLGNVWPFFDPWRTTFEVLQATLRALGLKQTTVSWPWPYALGIWPAVALLLFWSWLEVIYALPSSPQRIGLAILIWSLINISGMFCFGREVWQRHADVFAIYFEQLGRMAPCQPRGLKTPGEAPLQFSPRSQSSDLARVGFVMAMLAAVLFDGLHGSAPWLIFQELMLRWMPKNSDMNGYYSGALGLLGVWMALGLAYMVTCAITARWFARWSTLEIATCFIPTLVPIAVGYLIAHNFSGLIIQGQNLISLISDPLGRQWNLFGTAGRPMDIGLIDASTQWYVAWVAIVLGHTVSIWASHRQALAMTHVPAQATRMGLPLSVLMVVYTALSLLAISEPLVA